MSGETPVFSSYHETGSFADSVDAMAFVNGTLYAAMDNGDGTDSLVTVDHTNWANGVSADTTAVANLGIGHVGSMAWNGSNFVAMVDQTGSNPNDGGEFGGKSLYSISLDGGTVTQIAADVGDWVKVAYVPEPGTIALLGFGFVLLGLRRRG